MAESRNGNSWSEFVALAATQHGVVGRRQAARLGFPAARLRTPLARGAVDEPVPGALRVAGSPDSWRQRLMIGVLAHGGVASHRAAARLQRLDGWLRSLVIELTVVGGRKRRLDETVVHRAASLDDIDVVTVDGIPCTNVARTLCDLGAVVSDDIVEMALDEALRRGVSLRWVEETHQRLHRPGPSGTHSLGRVLALSDRQGVVPDSFRERMTERLLTHPDLTTLIRQHLVRDGDGRTVARLDLAIPDALVGIEFHSDQWHHGPRRGRGDRRRDLALARLGWEVVYLDATDHREPDAAVAAVLDVVRWRRAA